MADFSARQKSAGSTEAVGDLFADGQALQNVIGAGGVGQGLQDPDVVGPWPNDGLTLQAYVQTLDVTAYAPSTSAPRVNGTPPTTLLMPFEGTIVGFLRVNQLNHVLSVYKNGKVIYSAALGVSLPAALGGLQHVAMPGGTSAYHFKRGDEFSFANFAAGSPTEVPGNDRHVTQVAVPASYSFEFTVEDD